MVYKSFDKKTRSGVSVNEQLAEELHKPVIKKFKRRKVYARFKESIWAADLPKMESLSSKNKNVKYLLCVIDVFTKYAWFKPLKDKKGKTVLNAFIEIVNESNRKPNKLWVDQGREFYNKPRILPFFKSRFRNFNQNQLGIGFFKPFAVTRKCKFH